MHQKTNGKRFSFEEKTLQRNYDSLMEKFCSAAELEWKLNQHFPEEIH